MKNPTNPHETDPTTNEPWPIEPLCCSYHFPVTQATGGDLALAAFSAECAADEEARADRRFRSFQNRQVAA